jgi:hypothetical protein
MPFCSTDNLSKVLGSSAVQCSGPQLEHKLLYKYPFLPILTSSSSAAGSGYEVLNSEKHGWKQFVKPDFAIVPNAYWKQQNHNMSNLYKEGKFGVVTDPKVFDTVRSVVDVKCHAFNDDNRGQLRDYALRILRNVEGKARVHGKIFTTIPDCGLDASFSLRPLLCRSPYQWQLGF